MLMALHHAANDSVIVSKNRNSFLRLIVYLSIILIYITYLNLLLNFKKFDKFNNAKDQLFFFFLFYFYHFSATPYLIYVFNFQRKFGYE